MCVLGLVAIIVFEDSQVREVGFKASTPEREDCQEHICAPGSQEANMRGWQTYDGNS